MKTLLKLTTLIVIALSFCGCSVGDDNKEATPDVITLLSKREWKIQSVTVDGVDQTLLFQGMVVRFTSQYQYSTTHGGPIWAVNGSTGGSFTLQGDEQMQRTGDNLTIHLEVTDTTLKLELQWNKDTVGPGRISSISGHHVFNFVP